MCAEYYSRANKVSYVVREEPKVFEQMPKAVKFEPKVNKFEPKVLQPKVKEPNVLVIPRNSNDTLESYRLIVQKTGGPIARNLLFSTC